MTMVSRVSIPMLCCTLVRMWGSPFEGKEKPLSQLWWQHLLLPRLRYYDHIQRCVDFFYKPCGHCRANPLLGHWGRHSPQQEGTTRWSILLRRISWSGLSLPCHWRCLMISSLRILSGPMWSPFISGSIHRNTTLWLLWWDSYRGVCKIRSRSSDLLQKQSLWWGMLRWLEEGILSWCGCACPSLFGKVLGGMFWSWRWYFRVFLIC